MKRFLKGLVKWTIYIFIVMVILTYSTRGPSKSKFDNAWNNMKFSITRLTGHEFETSPPPAVVTPTPRPRGPNGETPEVSTKVITEEILEPGKWLTVNLKGERGGQYKSLKVAWKSGPIYRRWLNKDGRVMITLLGIGETAEKGKVMRVNDITLQPMEKKFHDGGHIEGAAAVQFMPANGKIPVKVRLEIE